MKKKFKINCSSLLSLLLHAIAIKHSIDPTGNQLGQLIDKSCNCTGDAGYFDTPYDTIGKWARYGVKKKPQENNLKFILKFVNHLLFEKEKVGEYEISNLDHEFNKLPLPSWIIKKIEDMCDAQLNRELIIDKVLIATEYDIDPTEINAMAKSGVVKPAFLYQSPLAAKIWDKVKTNTIDYPHYNACERGLVCVLNSNEWKERQERIGLVFNLGAGSASKDRRILGLLNNKADKAVYAWVDASISMLFHTIRDVKGSLKNIIGVALQVDFEQAMKMKSLYEKSFPDFPSFNDGSIVKVFFILGFTLSNLDEESFFRSYGKICNVGDLFIFPMQFIPEKCNEKQEMMNYKAKLADNYGFSDGKKLATEGLTYLDGFKPINHPKPVVNNFKMSCSKKKSLSIDYSVRIKENVDGAEEKPLLISKSTRHYEDTYSILLKEYGFKKLYCSTENEGVKTLLVEFVGTDSPYFKNGD